MQLKTKVLILNSKNLFSSSFRKGSVRHWGNHALSPFHSQSASGQSGDLRLSIVSRGRKDVFTALCQETQRTEWQWNIVTKHKKHWNWPKRVCYNLRTTGSPPFPPLLITPRKEEALNVDTYNNNKTKRISWLLKSLFSTTNKSVNILTLFHRQKQYFYLNFTWEPDVSLWPSVLLMETY